MRLHCTGLDGQVRPDVAALGERIAATVEKLEWREDEPPEGKDGFNMARTVWECGSPQCLAGWTERIRRKAAKLTTERDGWVMHDAAGALQMTRQGRLALFQPGHEDGKPCRYHYGARPGEEGHIPPALAAAALRRYMRTGEVSWTKAAKDLENTREEQAR